MNCGFRKVSVAGVCALDLGVGITLQTAAANPTQGHQEGLSISEKNGKFELSGTGLALKSVGKARKSESGVDSDPLALASQKSTPYRGQTDEYTVVDRTGRAVDTVLDRTVEVSNGGARRTGWVRTSDSVAVEWPTAEGVTKWEVKKPNGETVTTSQTVLVDNGNAESGTYLITGTASDGAVKSYVLTIPDAESQGNDQQADFRAKQNAVEPEQWRGFTWAAFIEEEKIQGKVGPAYACLEAAKGYHSYNGNDRGYSNSVQGLYNAGEPRFKVGSAVASTWKYPAWVNPSIYDGLIGKATGKTIAYDESGAVVDSARADADTDVRLVRGTSEILPANLGGLGLATREVKMSSANPLCTVPTPGPGTTESPAIDVEYTYRHTSNGWVTVQGRHDKAPMHEAFGPHQRMRMTQTSRMVAYIDSRTGVFRNWAGHWSWEPT